MTKTHLRQKCLQELHNIPKVNQRHRDARLNKTLLHHPRLRRAKSVLAFWPLGLEPDIRSTLHTLRRSKKVYLPFMEYDSFKMVPFRLPLKLKKFGIYEPGNSNRKIKTIDIAIVPAVGVDGEGRRIGFGKGMYDRFFAKLHVKPYIIFVQNRPCNTTHYICDDYDVKADQLITPHLCYSIKKGTNYDKRNTLRRWHCHA